MLLLWLPLLLLSCTRHDNRVGYVADPQTRAAEEIIPLPLGAKMPAFKLISARDQFFDSRDLSNARAILVIFMSNHCSFSQGYEQRIKDIVKDYQKKGLRVVAISPNSPLAISDEDLSHSDLSDDFPALARRSQDQAFSFPYLYDGDDQMVSQQFGPTKLPEVFLFDQDQTLRYRGLIDGSPQPGRAQANRLRNAINAVLENRAIIRAETNPLGCEVKWSWSAGEKAEKDKKWLDRPVGLKSIDLDSMKTLMVNFSQGIRLINFWATWCGPCKLEYPELLRMQRMFGGRRFEFVSVSLDEWENREEVLTFLQQVHSPVQNFIYSQRNLEKLAAAVHSNWDGTLPFTIILEPYGEVYKYWLGPIDPIEVRKAIVEHRLLGRFYRD